MKVISFEPVNSSFNILNKIQKNIIIGKLILMH